MLDNFDPTKIVNFSSERALFERLLHFSDDRRILTITEERSGFGKTSLIKKMRHICISQDYPVSLIQLGSEEALSPYILAKHIVRELKNKVEFTQFNAIDDALELNDLAALQPYLQNQGVRGEVQVNKIESGAENNQVASFIYNDNRHHISLDDETKNIASSLLNSPITPERKTIIYRQALKIFLDEIEKYLKKYRKPVVLLFDAYEKCSLELQKWILADLIAPLYFKTNRLPKRLLMVFAGQQVPKLDHEFPQERCDKIVHKIPELSSWTEKDLIFCLNQYNVDKDGLEITAGSFHNLMLSMKLSPLDVITLIESKHDQR